ncbi:MAG: hypothetical protein KJ717_00380, partial [Proteobacteria bacterium]|nr:hypothetical protein [Pseudomonadota bacterium]
PPGAFRYQRQSGSQSLFTPSPLSGQEDVPEREEERLEAVVPDDSPQVDRPADNGEQARLQPVARPSGAEAAQHLQAQPPAPIMPDQMPTKPVAHGAEEPRPPVPDHGPTALGEIKAEQDHRQEIAIPGRSTVRQVFSSLMAAKEDENIPAADRRQPAMTQQPSPLPAGQARPKSAAVDLDERSAPLPRRPAAAQPTLDRQTQGMMRSLPAAAPEEGMATQESTPSATGQRGRLEQNTTNRIAGSTGKAAMPAAAPEVEPNLSSRQQQQHPPTQAEPGAKEIQPSVTPARRPDEDGPRQIEELRRTFYELVNKKSSAPESKAKEQTDTAEGQTPPPPLQQIVVINRTAGSRSPGRLPAAFWERSYMARTTLKMSR